MSGFEALFWAMVGLAVALLLGWLDVPSLVARMRGHR